jgi:diguanylate cyclase (GGDEF)-like protein
LREVTFLHHGQPLGQVTVSLGVAIFPEHATSPKALVKAADAALYRAKREGRDRVAIAEAHAEEDHAAFAASPTINS